MSNAWDRGIPSIPTDPPGIPLAIGREVNGAIELEIVATEEQLAAVRERAIRHPGFATWLRRVIASAAADDESAA